MLPVWVKDFHILLILAGIGTFSAAAENVQGDRTVLKALLVLGSALFGMGSAAGTVWATSLSEVGAYPYMAAVDATFVAWVVVTALAVLYVVTLAVTLAPVALAIQHAAPTIRALLAVVGGLAAGTVVRIVSR